MISFVLATLVTGIIIFILIGAIGHPAVDLDKEQFRTAWKSVVQKAQHQQTWEISIINADKLLDAALKKKGYKGSTMGERLISAKKALSNRNTVWESHKLRNRLVHEDTVRLNEAKVYETLKGFETALKDLGAL
jgi:hypothetical protein